MTRSLLWQTSVLASGVQAAATIAAGQSLVDVRLAAALREPARRLDDFLQSAVAKIEPVAEATGAGQWRWWPWKFLLELSLNDGDPVRIAADYCFLRDSFTDPTFSDRPERRRRAVFDGVPEVTPELAADIQELAARLTDVQHALLSVLPRLPVELPLRIGPIREQWEAYGPGFLARAQRRLELPPGPESARSVVLVHPVLGGGGWAHFVSQRVRFEALLTHANPQLPETLRLGWLLLQLAAWPWLETIPEGRRARLVGWAALPVALEAARYVELTSADPQLLTAAQAAWLPNDTDSPWPQEAPQEAARWWQEFEEAEPRQSWLDAVRALDERWP